MEITYANQKKMTWVRVARRPLRDTRVVEEGDQPIVPSGDHQALVSRHIHAVDVRSIGAGRPNAHQVEPNGDRRGGPRTVCTIALELLSGRHLPEQQLVCAASRAYQQAIVAPVQVRHVRCVTRELLYRSRLSFLPACVYVYVVIVRAYSEGVVSRTEFHIRYFFFAVASKHHYAETEVESRSALRRTPAGGSSARCLGNRPGFSGDEEDTKASMLHAHGDTMPGPVEVAA